MSAQPNWWQLSGVSGLEGQGGNGATTVHRHRASLRVVRTQPAAGVALEVQVLLVMVCVHLTCQLAVHPRQPASAGLAVCESGHHVGSGKVLRAGLSLLFGSSSPTTPSDHTRECLLGSLW